MDDPLLDTMMEILADSGIAAFRVVIVVSGTESVKALLNEGDGYESDNAGFQTQRRETVLRWRNGAITSPVVGGSVTAQEGSTAAVSYLVREVADDPEDPGMVRVRVTRT